MPVHVLLFQPLTFDQDCETIDAFTITDQIFMDFKRIYKK